MSKYSGKCDLADWIAGCGGWFDKDGNPVTFGTPGVGAYYSDEWLDFLAFKKETGGVLHQHKKVKVTEYNQEEVVKHCEHLTIIPHVQVVEDKRCKDGKKEVTTYTYKYWDKEYTLKELNKHGVWVTIDIHFDTLLDLIPYYPYIVSMGSRWDGKQTIYICDESYVLEQRDRLVLGGYFSDYWESYVKELQDHYREVVLKYYNPTGRDVVEEVFFYLADNGTYLGHTSHSIDANFKITWCWEDCATHTFWTSPKFVDDHTIEMSKEDYTQFIGNRIKVKFVRSKYEGED